MASKTRGKKSNNPEGKNQYNGGVFGSAKDHPFTAAAAVGGAVAAGVFLWSKRNQISEQISGLSEQISEWRDGLRADGETADDASFIASPAKRGKRKSQSDIAEEALTLKETGKAAEHPVDAVAH